MAAVTRTPAHQWVAAGLTALAVGGPESVRVEALARVLGVTKGGFYWHFADRQALLAAMLDAWQRSSLDEVIELVEGTGADPRVRLRRLFALASSSELRRVDLAVRIWAREDPRVARRLRAVDARRRDYLRTLFGAICTSRDDVEARCVIAMSLFVAGGFVPEGRGELGPPEVMRLVLDRLVS
jgi:AcrR family transcriptional regulator